MNDKAIKEIRIVKEGNRKLDHVWIEMELMGMERKRRKKAT